eukprot:TRINITY_DN925_c1_g1_i2.p1 TRINITY_DN925_c1_g1~~TRINITY_DN925_c1_g1_i2.p1  ORF type:complete len:217 (+),score=-22.98 TRINITY_DN925_c1_g1_i2:237-887(+)
MSINGKVIIIIIMWHAQYVKICTCTHVIFPYKFTFHCSIIAHYVPVIFHLRFFTYLQMVLFNIQTKNPEILELSLLKKFLKLAQTIILKESFQLKCIEQKFTLNSQVIQILCKLNFPFCNYLKCSFIPKLNKPKNKRTKVANSFIMFILVQIPTPFYNYIFFNQEPIQASTPILQNYRIIKVLWKSSYIKFVFRLKFPSYDKKANQKTFSIFGVCY